MNTELKVLFIEDCLEDAELEEVQLRKAGYAIRSERAETREGIIRALGDFDPHLVVSDYSLPQMNGLDALKIVRELKPNIPFIFVSGTIGEERAIESLRSGATDYVVKDRPASFVSKVKRALAEQEERAQRRVLEEQYRQAQKLEAIGRLTGGVAHDFNNMLTVINGFTELVLARMGQTHPMKGDLEEVLAAGRRASGLTRQLLAFSRKQVTQPTLLDLNALVNNLQKMLGRLLGEDIHLAIHQEPALYRVVADAGHIEQVLMNLVVNARDAMPDGGRITIETGNVDLSENDPERPPEAKPGSHVLLLVNDTGTGMTPEVRSHLFEPFFTTKEVGRGTGLGLSTVHGIVAQSGGAIRVESEVGEGTTFRIYLPKAPTNAAPAELHKPAPAARQGTETVLVAEDQESVRKLVRAILEGSGYRVLTAQGGPEALKICEDHEEPIKLLITDLVMRSMNGAELARLVRRLHPETRVLFMSGYTDRGVKEEGLLGKGAAFLHKPFTLEDLKLKVRETLEAP